METKLEGDEITLEVVFDSANYGKVACKIKIKDEVAVAVFSDRRLAKEMYFAEKKLAIDEVYYEERRSLLGTRYPKKSKEDIAEHLIKKFENHNIEVKKK